MLMGKHLEYENTFFINFKVRDIFQALTYLFLRKVNLFFVIAARGQINKEKSLPFSPEVALVNT